LSKKDSSGGGRVKIETPISCRTVFVLVLLFISLTGCLHSVRVVDDKDPKTTIPWLVDGTTTKEEVLQNFQNVDPLRTLSQGKIVIYAVNFDQQKGQITCSNECEYQLVLVFDENNVVKRHSILKNR
jgi:hypothetical protein